MKLIFSKVIGTVIFVQKSFMILKSYVITVPINLVNTSFMSPKALVLIHELFHIPNRNFMKDSQDVHVSWYWDVPHCRKTDRGKNWFHGLNLRLLTRGITYTTMRKHSAERRKYKVRRIKLCTIFLAQHFKLRTYPANPQSVNFSSVTNWMILLVAACVGKQPKVHNLKCRKCTT